MSAAAWFITFAVLLFHQGSAELLEPHCGFASPPIDGVAFSPSPWMALIKSNQRECSGVLIHQQYVITAASCLINQTEILVRLGEFNHYEEYNVKTAIIHRSFNESDYLNDIALLKLQRKVIFNPHIQPICVLMNSARKSIIDTFMQFGATLWGLNEMRQYQNPKTDIISRLKSNECLNILQVEPESSQICASFNTGANCREVGSPLGKMLINKGTYRYTLYGIQSYGTAKTCIFTDIMSFVDWIVGNVLDVGIVTLEIPKNERFFN